MGEIKYTNIPNINRTIQTGTPNRVVNFDKKSAASIARRGKNTAYILLREGVYLKGIELKYRCRTRFNQRRGRRMKAREGSSLKGREEGYIMGGRSKEKVRERIRQRESLRLDRMEEISFYGKEERVGRRIGVKDGVFMEDGL